MCFLKCELRGRRTSPNTLTSREGVFSYILHFSAARPRRGFVNLLGKNSLSYFPADIREFLGKLGKLKETGFLSKALMPLGY